MFTISVKFLYVSVYLFIHSCSTVCVTVVGCNNHRIKVEGIVFLVHILGFYLLISTFMFYSL